MKILGILIAIFCAVTVGLGQARQPSSPSSPFYIKSKAQIEEISKELEKQKGNQNKDIVPAKGAQMRVAVFHGCDHGQIGRRRNNVVSVACYDDRFFNLRSGH